MNQQDELGARIASLLGDGAEGLTAEQRERLSAARRQALQRAEAVRTAPVGALAWAGSLSRFTEQRVLGVRYLIPFAALVLGLLGVVYVHTATPTSEIADIDAALLTDELPINAFLDQGLDSWLTRSPR